MGGRTSANVVVILEKIDMPPAFGVLAVRDDRAGVELTLHNDPLRMDNQLVERWLDELRRRSGG